MVALTILVAGGAIWWAVGPSRPTELDAAFSGDIEPAWPPAAPADLGAELASTRAMRTLAAAGRLPDAGPLDAGPPIGGDLPGILVRTGWAADLYYIEAVFGGGRFEDAMPMAVLIHGRGDRARIPGGPFWDLGTPIRVIVPQAPDPLGEGFEWLPVRVGQGLVDRLTTALVARAAQVALMLRELQRTLPTVGRPLVAGFSQGGILTLALAVQHSDVVQAAFPLSGWLPPALVPTYRRDDVVFPRIRGMHGSADRVVQPEPTEDAYALLRERGFDTELVLFEGVGHEMTEAMDQQLHLWLLEALGVVVEDAFRRGLLDGGTPVCPPMGWPADAGWPRAPSPDGSMPDAGFALAFDAGPWWSCVDAGPDAGPDGEPSDLGLLDAGPIDAGLDPGAPALSSPL